MSISKTFSSLASTEIFVLISGIGLGVVVGGGLIGGALNAFKVNPSGAMGCLVSGIVVAGIGTVGPAGFILHRAWTLRDKSEAIEAAKGALEGYIEKL